MAIKDFIFDYIMCVFMHTSSFNVGFSVSLMKSVAWGVGDRLFEDWKI